LGRYSELYKSIYKRDPTDFPKPFNKPIRQGKKYRLKILTDPREVNIRYGRKAPIIEVGYHDRRYTLYISLVDLHNKLAMLEKYEEERTGKKEVSLVGRMISLKQIKPRRFEIELEPEQPNHQY